MRIDASVPDGALPPHPAHHEVLFGPSSNAGTPFLLTVFTIVVVHMMDEVLFAPTVQ